MPDLRVGLVGAGMVAAHHATAWSRCADAHIVAIADPDRQAAERLAPEHATVHDSLAALLQETDVDAIDIASPVATHSALVKESVAAGLPVLCQKPLAPDVEQARALVDALPAQARVMLHENWRWRESYRALKVHLAKSGPPTAFELSVESSGLCQKDDGSYPALTRQPFLAHLGRFIVFELLGHHLDVISYLFGPVEITDATIARRSAVVAGEDFADIRLRAGGVPGRLTGDFAVPDAPPRPRDMLRLDGKMVLNDWTLELDGTVQRWSHEDAYQKSYDRCIQHFTDCVMSGRAFETPVTSGVMLLELIETVYRHSG